MRYEGFAASDNPLRNAESGEQSASPSSSRQDWRMVTGNRLSFFAIRELRRSAQASDQREYLSYLIPHTSYPFFSVVPIPYSLFPIPYSLFPIPYSLFPALDHHHSHRVRCPGCMQG
jgi:hypothetical protein